MNDDMLIRSYDIDLKAEEDDIYYRVFGKALPYDTPTMIADYWEEKILAGAADETIAAGGQYMLWQHDRRQPLASVESKTLTLESAADGIYFRAMLPKETTPKEKYNLIKHGIINKVSIGFTTKDEDLDMEYDEKTDRMFVTIRRITKLYEVSPVTFAAYDDTAVATYMARCRKIAGVANTNTISNRYRLQARELEQARNKARFLNAIKN